MALTLKKIASYNVYGENLPLNTNTLRIMNLMDVTQSDDANVIFINRESIVFIEYFVKNQLKENQWLVIIPQNNDAERIYREYHLIGDSHIENNLVLFKNIKPNFKDLVRKNIMKPLENKQTLTEFLEFKTQEKNVQAEVLNGPIPETIVKSFSTQSDFVYVGQAIPKADILVDQMLCKMNFKIIENQFQDKTVGYFIDKKILNQFWISQLSKNKMVEDFFNINELKIIVPCSMAYNILC